MIMIILLSMTMMNSTLLINKSTSGKKYVDMHRCKKKQQQQQQQPLNFFALILSDIFGHRNIFRPSGVSVHSISMDWKRQCTIKVNAEIDRRRKSTKTCETHGKCAHRALRVNTEQFHFMAAAFIRNQLPDKNTDEAMVHLSCIFFHITYLRTTYIEIHRKYDELESMHRICIFFGLQLNRSPLNTF